VLDILLKERRRYADRLDMVHVEIYRAATGTDLVPTLDAWELQSEPWLFGVRGDGTVAGRVNGAFDAAEVRRLLDATAS
jgi:hypothetical protein